MMKDKPSSPPRHEAPSSGQRQASAGDDAGATQEPRRGAKPPRLPVDCGDLGMRIARDGTWFFRNSPIGRLPLVKLFASVLRREGDDYWLVTPAERGRIAVDDVPFVAVALDVEGEGRDQALVFRTNLDDIVTADADHPLRVAERASGEPIPYLLVRNGLEARLARAVFYQLVELGAEERLGAEMVFGVWSRNQFFRLGTLAS